MAKTKNDTVIAFTREVSWLNTAFRQYLQQILRRNNTGLTYEMLQILACLWTNNGINQQEIANITVKDKASMTYLIDNLTKRKLVYRQEDSNDRRNKLIFLTDEGKMIQEKAQFWFAELYALVGKDIPLDVIGDMIKTLEKIRNNLKNAQV